MPSSVNSLYPVGFRNRGSFDPVNTVSPKLMTLNVWLPTSPNAGGTSLRMSRSAGSDRNVSNSSTVGFSSGARTSSSKTDFLSPVCQTDRCGARPSSPAMPLSLIRHR